MADFTYTTRRGLLKAAPALPIAGFASSALAETSPIGEAYARWKTLYARAYPPGPPVDIGDELIRQVFEAEDVILAQPARSMRDLAAKIIVADADGEFAGISEAMESLLAEAKGILQ